MGRKKTYNTTEVLEQMVTVFRQNGFEGTSLDDLQKATGLLRGSLYSAFGSKRGMFEAALKFSVTNDMLSEQALHMLLIALLELAHRDIKMNQYIQNLFNQYPELPLYELLGKQLLKQAKITRSESNGKSSENNRY